MVPWAKLKINSERRAFKVSGNVYSSKNKQDKWRQSRVYLPERFFAPVTRRNVFDLSAPEAGPSARYKFYCVMI